MISLPEVELLGTDYKMHHFRGYILSQFDCFSVWLFVLSFDLPHEESCEETEETCDDGFDNDGDGYSDCLDQNCNGVDGCEYGVETNCDDEYDNDADGDIDCLDADCSPSVDCAGHDCCMVALE